MPSASERLRELGREHASDEPFELTRQEAVEGALIRALPLIADCIEAAERVDRYRNQYEGAMIELGWTFGDVLAITANHNALTALTAALEGGEDA